MNRQVWRQYIKKGSSESQVKTEKHPQRILMAESLDPNSYLQPAVTDCVLCARFDSKPLLAVITNTAFVTVIIIFS